MNFLGLAGLVYDPAAPACAPKWVAMIVAALMIGGQPRRLPPAVWCWLALTLWMALAGAPEWLGFAAAAALMVAALGHPADKVREAAGSAAVMMGVGSSVVAIVQFCAGASWNHGGQGNPDWLGLLLAAVLPCSLEWARKHRRWEVIAVEVAGLASARSRTAWLALLVVWILSGPRRRLLLLPLAAGIAVVGAHALEGRLYIWRIAAEILRPLGAGRFDAAFAAAQGEHLRALSIGEASRRFVYTASAHNDWLQVAAVSGLPALLLLVAVFAFAARARWPAGRATLAVVALSALGDTPLTQPAVLLLLALILAAFPTEKARTSPRLWVGALTLAVALPSYFAQRLVTRARDQDPETRAATLALAEKLDSRSGPVAFEVGLSALERHDLDAAIVHFERARQCFWQPATEVALGNAWMQKGDPERAITTYENLLRLQPGSLRARLNLVEALRRQGRLDEAAEQLRIAQRLWPSLPLVREFADRLDD